MSIWLSGRQGQAMVSAVRALDFSSLKKMPACTLLKLACCARKCAARIANSPRMPVQVLASIAVNGASAVVQVAGNGVSAGSSERMLANVLVLAESIAPPTMVGRSMLP